MPVTQTQMDDDPLKNVAGYEAETLTVDPATQTVQGQIQNITSKNSPLMQLARTGARQEGAARGLLNTSMTAGAGERAVLQQALPIAQQDANTQFQAAQGNQQATNQASQFTAGGKTQIAQQQLAGEQQKQQIQAQGAQQSALQSQQANFDKVMQQLRGDQQTRLEQMAQKNQRLLQNNANAAGIMQQGLAQITAILQNPDIPQSAKQSHIDKIQTMMDDQINVLGKSLDINLGSVVNTGITAQNTSQANTLPSGQKVLRPEIPGLKDNSVARRINEIHMTATNEQQALNQMYNFLSEGGYNAAGAAQVLGLPTSVVNEQLAKIGKSL